MTCVNANLANNEGPDKHSEMAKQDPENDGVSSSSTNESENKKSSSLLVTPYCINLK